VNQYTALPKAPSTGSESSVHIDIDQSAPGVSPSKELRCLDGLSRDHSDWLFGDVKDQARWISQIEIDDEFLKSGWLAKEERKDLIWSQTISENKGWTATQIWGFQDVNGERRHCRNIVIEKEEQRAEFRFVYDWQQHIEHAK
jgi:hypothetical protein